MLNLTRHRLFSLERLYPYYVRDMKSSLAKLKQNWESEKGAPDKIIQSFDQIQAQLEILEQNPKDDNALNEARAKFAPLKQEILNLLSIQLEELKQPTQTEGQDNQTS